MTPSYHPRQDLSQVQISKTGQVQGHYRRPINTYRYGVISHV